MGLCLAALFALGAIGAAGASAALPEIGVCVAQAGTGKYENANCTELAGSKAEEKQFEFRKEIPPEKEPSNGFTALGGHMSWEEEEGNKWECNASSVTGEYVVKFSSTTGKQLPIHEVTNVVWRMTSCTKAGKNCQNKGGTAGEIVSEPLKGPIGYIKGKGTKAPEVGQELTPVKAKGVVFDFECSGFATQVIGAKPLGTLGDCLIAPFTAGSINIMSTEAEVLFNGTKTGAGQEQLPQAFEGKSTHCNLETKHGEGPWERLILVGQLAITSEQALEIKA